MSGERCVETIYVPDTYRYTGGKRQFKLHHWRRQCSRTAQAGRAYCWQHPYSDPPRLAHPRAAQEEGTTDGSD